MPAPSSTAAAGTATTSWSRAFPSFSAFTPAAAPWGRWRIVSYQEPIQIGDITIHPGDFMMADIDGVIAIPKDHILEVLEKAEEMFDLENRMGQDMAGGLGVRAAFDKYGVI